MFKYFILIAALPAILCQGGEESITPYVTGGRAAFIGEFASDCSIDTPLQLHCQGILIDNRHVLTSASCVVDENTSAVINPALLRVLCGDNSLLAANSGREERTVSHIFPHDHFNPNNNNNGLAMIRLQTPISLPHNTAEAALLQDRIMAEGVQCTFSGWGAANNASDVVNQLKMVIDAPIVNRMNCNLMANAGLIQETMICAGLITPIAPAPLVAQTVCRGNIGGGLYCNGRVSGILSFGLSCGNPNQPGVYIQPRFYQTWINQQLNRNDTIAPGTVFPRP